MRTVFKFPLLIRGEQHIMLPVRHKVLSLQMQRGIPTMWVELEENDPCVGTFVRMIGTGHMVRDDATVYIGTVQDNEGYVWHYYKTYEG